MGNKLSVMLIIVSTPFFVEAPIRIQYPHEAAKEIYRPREDTEAIVPSVPYKWGTERTKYGGIRPPVRDRGTIAAGRENLKKIMADFEAISRKSEAPKKLGKGKKFVQKDGRWVPVSLETPPAPATPRQPSVDVDEWSSVDLPKVDVDKDDD